MRFHRFFIESKISEGSVNSFPSAPLMRQLKTVFRLHAGDTAIFFDGTGIDYESEIVSLEKDVITFRVRETRDVKPACETRLALAPSLIKKDNLEWVIQKGTELGVSEFVPVVSDRSEKKGFNLERAQRIMTEALEQSGRSDLATVREPIALADFLVGETRLIIAFHTSGETLSADAIAKLAPKGSEVVALVGPEGGWSDAEIDAFRKKGATIVRFNSPVLRAETAAIAIATLFLVR